MVRGNGRSSCGGCPGNDKRAGEANGNDVFHDCCTIPLWNDLTRPSVPTCEQIAKPTWYAVFMKFRLALAILIVVGCGQAAGALAAPASPLGVVRAIHLGLSVLPPQKPAVHGRVGQSLYLSYGLRTRANQKASVRFMDGSVLFVNERSDLVLRSSRLVALKKGEVAIRESGGKHHIVQTATATTAALGTVYNIRIERTTVHIATPGLPTKTFPPGTTTVSVVKGLVVVSNAQGQVQLTPGHWTHVVPGLAPTAPVSHNAAQDIDWTKGL